MAEPIPEPLRIEVTEGMSLEVEWPDAMIQDYQPSSAGPLTQAFPLADLDLILLGYPLQNEERLALLRSMRSRSGCPPVIVFAADGDEFLAVDAMNEPRAYMVGKRLIDMGKSPPAAAIEDLSADLKTLLKA